MASGWGFKIDYDKAIAADEARVALLSSPKTVALTKVLEAAAAAGKFEGCFNVDIWDPAQLAFVVPEVAEILALTNEDLRGIATYCESSDKIIDHFGGTCESGGADYRHGKKVYERLYVIERDYASPREYAIYLSEAKRVADLKKAKSDLSRHKRNKAKWGTK